MDQGYFLKATSRREMLRAASFLAGGSALAGLMPRTLLAEPQATPAGKAQNPSSTPADPVEQMKAQMASVPLQTLKLRDNIQMLYGPGGNMVVLDGPDGKILVDSSFASVAPKVKQALDGISNTPFKMLINTHWHIDPTDGHVLVSGRFPEDLAWGTGGAAVVMIPGALCAIGRMGELHVFDQRDGSPITVTAPIANHSLGIAHATAVGDYVVYGFNRGGYRLHAVAMSAIVL